MLDSNNSFNNETLLSDIDSIDNHSQSQTKNTYDDRKNATQTLLDVADKLLKENEKSLGNIDIRKISPKIYLEEIQPDGVIKKRALIDLVQQGGTMWGIALVGYTYVMERVGIRFNSLAGTSAGSINSLLLAALPNEVYSHNSAFSNIRGGTKSELLAHLIANKNFTSILDKQGIIGAIQRLAIKHINKMSKLLKPILGLSLLMISVFLFWLFAFKVFDSSFHVGENTIRIFCFLATICSVIVALLFFLLAFFRIFSTHLGINPGEVFYGWITNILRTKQIDVFTTADLEIKRPKYVLKVYDNTINTVNNRRYVFITSNLTYNRIVKFPERASDYWQNKDDVNPAAYIRSSMSIPFLFHAFTPESKHGSTPKGFSRFVDGGMLSNFPIREFDVKNDEDRRYPTFGVLLSSPFDRSSNMSLEEYIKEYKNNISNKRTNISVFKYILSFISTFRNFYDTDFLISTPDIEKRVELIDTGGISSLDFFMNMDKKKELFEAGATAAIRQIQKTLNQSDTILENLASETQTSENTNFTKQEKKIKTITLAENKIYNRLWKIWAVLLIAIISTMAFMINPELNHLVSKLEFAGSTAAANEIISSTHFNKFDILLRNTKIDFLFIVFYSLLAFFSIRIITTLMEKKLSKGKLVSVFIFCILGGIIDALFENPVLLDLAKNHIANIPSHYPYLVRLKWVFGIFYVSSILTVIALAIGSVFNYVYKLPMFKSK